MDDHMYNRLWEYAECDLIPRFQIEYEETGNMLECASYEEVETFCKALNIIGDWLGYERMTPARIIDKMIEL